MQKHKPYKLLFLSFVSIFLSATVWITGALTDIPDHFIEPGGTFSTIPLTNYLVEGTACNTFEIVPILTTGTAQKPQNCSIYEGYSENMTATVKCAYLEQTFFKHPDDYIIAYDEMDNIVACAVSSMDPFNEGERLFYLTVQGGNTSYPIKIEFYSGEYQQSYTIPAALTFMQDANMGDALNPVTLLVGPLGMEINNNQELMPSIRDSTWMGRQCFTVNAIDCTDETTGTDRVCFSVGQSELPCPETEILNTEIFTNQFYQVEKAIIATNTIMSSADVVYQAGESIILLPGFEVKAGGDFVAKIESCTPTPLGIDGDEEQQKAEIAGLATQTPLAAKADELQLTIAPNPAQYEVSIRTFLPKATKAVLMISNQNGQVLQQRILAPNEGWQNTTLNTDDLSNGLYFLGLQTATEFQVEKLMVLR